MNFLRMSVSPENFQKHYKKVVSSFQIKTSILRSTRYIIRMTEHILEVIISADVVKPLYGQTISTKLRNRSIR